MHVDIINIFLDCPGLASLAQESSRLADRRCLISPQGPQGWALPIVGCE